MVGIIVFLIAVVCIVSYVVVKKATTEGIWLGDYKYYFNLEDKTASIRDYRGNETKITLPTKIVGFKITKIDISSTKFDGGASEEDGVKVIYVPKEMDIIDIGNASSLEEIYFEDGTTNITCINIDSCNNLKIIDIPETVKSISILGLTYADKLENIEFPKEITNIGLFDLYDVLFENKHLNDKYYVVGGSKSYYAKIDDLNMIRMIQNWNENGLEGIYNQDFCDKMSRHESTLVKMICEDLDVSSSEQREQVEAAVSIFIHGNEDGNNLYYTSVTEIPVDIMLKCVTRADDIIKNNNEKFGNDYASVEDQIESYR
ncbi:leucine-rich repeat protein [Pseudobutyrivibrio ruminis]|uniref:Leucine rich repeat-containing protein n=1 Tax=Pseudobutyrivibrio ruminis TaxID=46206 RepID=A0A2G3DXE5_9FIRM|nr:leucine-rich repeat protein [Pseudobutyrivibrio ruminis]PHU35702.1 hypothetical protein CSX01_03620 [Pseudobutyrivibrio ruminis]